MRTTRASSRLIRLAACAALGLASAASAQPSNDECATALGLTLNVARTGTTSGANTSVALPAASCGLSAGSGGGADVFFTFQAPATDRLDISACGAGFDTVLSIHSGCPTDANILACNDDSARCTGNTSRSFLAGVPVTANTTYTIRLAGFVGAAGAVAGPYSITVTPAQPVILAASATPNRLTSAGGQVLIAASYSPGSLPNTVTSATVDLSSVGGSATQQLFDDGTNGDVAPSDNTYSFLATVPADQSPGLRALPVRITDSQNRTVTASAALGVEPPAPANDTCETATAIPSVPFTSGPIAVGGAAGDLDTTCNSGAVTNSGVWFTFTPAENCNYTFSERGTLDTVIAVYSGGCAALAPLTCVDAPENSFTFQVQAGTVYHVLVGARSAARAGVLETIDLSVYCTQPPANDTCATAVNLTSQLPYRAAVNNAAATADQDVGACNTGAATQFGVWYTFTAPAAGAFRFSEDGNQEVSWGLFNSCGSAASFACLGTDSSQFRTLTAGQSIAVLVGSSTASTTPPVSPLVLGFDFLPVQALTNDACSGAVAIDAFPYSATYNNDFATADAPGASCNFDPASTLQNSIWFRIDVDTGGQLTGAVETYGSYNAILAIYSGECGTLAEAYCADEPDTPFPINLTLDSDTSYFIRVGDEGGTEGGGLTTLDLAFSGTVGTPNDCVPDFNHDAAVNVLDIFAYLTAWFAQDPAANVNGDDVVNVLDIFAFLTLWFAGCP